MYSSTNYCLGCSNRRSCMCQTATVPCSCVNPMTSWYNNNINNVVQNSNTLLNYQGAPENTIYGTLSHASNLVNPPFHVANNHEGSEQMATNEIGSWLMSNHDGDHDQIDWSSSLQSYGYYAGNQYQGQFIQMEAQGIQTSLLPTVAGNVPDATFGTMDLPLEWLLNQFSFPPFDHENLIREPARTQQQVSRDDLQKPSENPPMSRQDRILRYFEKKKARKYEKKVACSSRKAYAQTRPRIRGKFAKVSQTDTDDKTSV